MTTSRQVALGTLVCPLTLASDVTTKPGNHVAYFEGSVPCDKDGVPLSKLVIGSQPQQLLGGNVFVDHTFSSKPSQLGYPDYYQLRRQPRAERGPGSMRREVMQPEFVEAIPRELEEGVLYISIFFATAVHNCCCGCGNRVVTPLTPFKWKLSYDGEAVWLSPSIGNWSFPCQSHYWIKRSRVQWDGQWSAEEIAAGRKRDLAAQQKHFASVPAPPVPAAIPSIAPVALPVQPAGFWKGLWRKLSRSND